MRRLLRLARIHCERGSVRDMERGFVTSRVARGEERKGVYLARVQIRLGRDVSFCATFSTASDG